jgi:hypothetical protein
MGQRFLVTPFLRVPLRALARLVESYAYENRIIFHGFRKNISEKLS